MCSWCLLRALTTSIFAQYLSSLACGLLLECFWEKDFYVFLFELPWLIIVASVWIFFSFLRKKDWETLLHQLIFLWITNCMLEFQCYVSCSGSWNLIIHLSLGKQKCSFPAGLVCVVPYFERNCFYLILSASGGITPTCGGNCKLLRVLYYFSSRAKWKRCHVCVVPPNINQIVVVVIIYRWIGGLMLST